MTRWHHPIICALLTCVGIAPASAQSCTASFAMNFGTVDLTSAAAIPISSMVSISCSGGTPGQTVRACPGIDANRQMARTPASGTIQYELYTDASYQPASMWGSIGGTSPPAIDVVIGAGGNGSTTHTIYGLILGNQTTVPTDNVHPVYTQTPAVDVASADASGNPTCLAIGSSNLTGGSASISATYQPTCTLSADALAFGSLATTQSGSDALTQLHAACSAATPFAISMNGGLTGALNPELRQMQNGANRLTYGIYRDAGRTQAWGDSTGSDDYGGTGTGANLSIPVYGRIQPQSTPPVGNYSDTVVVTINY